MKKKKKEKESNPRENYWKPTDTNNKIPMEN